MGKKNNKSKDSKMKYTLPSDFGYTYDEIEENCKKNEKKLQEIVERTRQLNIYKDYLNSIGLEITTGDELDGLISDLRDRYTPTLDTPQTSPEEYSGPMPYSESREEYLLRMLDCIPTFASKKSDRKSMKKFINLVKKEYSHRLREDMIDDYFSESESYPNIAMGEEHEDLKDPHKLYYPSKYPFAIAESLIDPYTYEIFHLNDRGEDEKVGWFRVYSTFDSPKIQSSSVRIMHTLFPDYPIVELISYPSANDLLNPEFFDYFTNYLTSILQMYFHRKMRKTTNCNCDDVIFLTRSDVSKKEFPENKYHLNKECTAIINVEGTEEIPLKDILKREHDMLNSHNFKSISRSTESRFSEAFIYCGNSIGNKVYEERRKAVFDDYNLKADDAAQRAESDLPQFPC